MGTDIQEDCFGLSHNPIRACDTSLEASWRRAQSCPMFFQISGSNRFKNRFEKIKMAAGKNLVCSFVCLDVLYNSVYGVETPNRFKTGQKNRQKLISKNKFLTVFSKGSWVV